MDEHLAHVQSAGNEVVVMADDELTRQTMALNQTLSQLIMSSAQPLEQRLAELNVQGVAGIKPFKRSLDAFKTQHEEVLSLRASVQVVAALRREVATP